MRQTRPVLVLALTALVGTLMTAPAAARGGPQDAGPPPGAGPNPEWTIDRAQVAGLVDAIDDDEDVLTVSGEIAGAAYVGQRPDDWNGRLVVWAHGYRGEFATDPEVTVDPPPLFADLVADGTAWIASSYRRNSYDPGIGVIDTKNVTRRAEQLFGKADHTYVAGVSMGGHVIGAAIERYPELYDGALPACGVMGDVELFDYFLDYNLGAAAFANRVPGVDIDVRYPDDDWVGDEVVAIKKALSTYDEAAALGVPVDATAWAFDGSLLVGSLADFLAGPGEDLKSFVEVGSGGERGLIYDVAWDYWHVAGGGNFFFDLGEGDGTIANRTGIVGQNSDTSYEQEYGAAFASLDGTIERVTASDRVRKAQGSKPAPIINGTPMIPVLTMHTIGDLFVPIEMQQLYALEVAANGLADNLVQRAIRDVGHCTFSNDEWETAYADLFDWVEGGVTPLGDDLVADISDPLLGIPWTINDGTAEPRGGIRLFGGQPPLP